MLAAMDDDVPVIVRMRVECVRCGHAEDDTYEFDLPLAKAQPREEYVPGKCPECSAAVQMHLKRTQQRQ
jgi:Zn ribbon nucleic-acid-binding protein